MAEHTPCAGAIVLDDARRLLLIRRGRPPEQGLWSIPGGRCRPGEPAAATCVREVAEETGLRVVVQRLAGRVQRDGLGGVYVIDDFVCAAVGGSLQAGDDAVEARWVRRDELAALDLVGGLLDALTGWEMLPS